MAFSIRNALIALALAVAVPVLPVAAQQQQTPLDADQPYPRLPALQALAADAAVAEALGNLAAERSLPDHVSLLAASIREAAAEISRDLDRVQRREGVDLPRDIPPDAQVRLDALAEEDGRSFIAGFSDFVTVLYPDLIARSRQAGLPSEHAERLEYHLDAARQLDDDGSLPAQTAEGLRDFLDGAPGEDADAEPPAD